MVSRNFVVVEFRPTTTDHGPLAPASTRAVGSRSHAAADRQANRRAEPVGQL